MLQTLPRADRFIQLAKDHGFQLPDVMAGRDLPNTWAALGQKVFDLLDHRLISPTFAKTLLSLPEEKLLGAVLSRFSADVSQLCERMMALEESHPELSEEIGMTRENPYLDERISAMDDLESKLR